MSAVPALRFPGFEGEWEESPLGTYITFKNEINAERSQYGSGRKFINVLDGLTRRPRLSSPAPFVKCFGFATSSPATRSSRRPT